MGKAGRVGGADRPAEEAATVQVSGGVGETLTPPQVGAVTAPPGAETGGADDAAGGARAPEPPPAPRAADTAAILQAREEKIMDLMRQLDAQREYADNLEATLSDGHAGKVQALTQSRRTHLALALAVAVALRLRCSACSSLTVRMR